MESCRTVDSSNGGNRHCLGISELVSQKVKQLLSGQAGVVSGPCGDGNQMPLDWTVALLTARAGCDLSGDRSVRIDRSRIRGFDISCAKARVLANAATEHSLLDLGKRSLNLRSAAGFRLSSLSTPGRTSPRLLSATH